jgi:ribosomal protein L40E
MNNTLLDTVKKLVSEKGIEILDDSKKVNAYLSDLAAKEPKSQRITLIKCLEYSFHIELKKVTIPEERERCKKLIAQKLHDEEATDLAICADSLDLLEAVLFGAELEAQSALNTMLAEKEAEIARLKRELEAAKAVPVMNTPPVPSAPPQDQFVPIQQKVIISSPGIIKEWVCEKCGDSNPDSSSYCKGCGSYRRNEKNIVGIRNNHAPIGKWSCKICGDNNPATASICKGCGSYR